MDGILYSVPVMDFLSVDIGQCWEHFFVAATHFHDAALCSDALHKCSQGSCRCKVNPADKTKVQDDLAVLRDCSELLPEMLNTREGEISLRTEKSKTALLGQLDTRFGLLVEEQSQMEHTANNETHLHAPEEAKKEGHSVGEQVQLCKQV